MKQLAEVLAGPPLAAYTYSYPHKTAHRPLEPAISLRELWSAEERRALFLYFHVPFCPHRCGYCNLFSLARPEKHVVRRWLDAVKRQADRVGMAIGEAQFARIAIGGGTPTLLDLRDLECLLHIAEKLRGCVAEKIPYSVEVSPSTVSEEKLRLLRQFGVTRISIGVQTFAPQETAFLDRPQSPEIVARALQSIRNINFSVLNIDLMYGLPGQTRESWRNSLHSALTWRPEEIFLYPLYVRPLTGLAEHPEEHEGTPVEAYREGRDLLLAAGYTQISMRMFRLSAAAPQDYPPYCCQEDGMVGIGCGARSYTRNLHYSTPYAVTARNVANLIDQYSSCTAESFDWADFGFYLDSEDQRRRYVLLSLLEHEGLTVPDYLARFDSHPLTDLPELILLTQHGLMNASSDCLRLTANGLERSDAIGPWLYSDKVRQLLEEYSPC